MRTWYCRECTAFHGEHTYHVDRGRAGCETCGHYEARVEVKS